MRVPRPPYEVGSRFESLTTPSLSPLALQVFVKPENLKLHHFIREFSLVNVVMFFPLRSWCSIGTPFFK
jgi:hypothetical protein